MGIVERSSNRNDLFVGVALAALTLWPTAAAAQDATAAPRDDDAEIIVTGSRIAREGFSAPSPTTILGVEELQQRGLTNIGQISSTIPSFLGTTTPATTSLNSARAGGSYLNLRGLGDIRTLTLVNGRRVVPSNAEGSVDTNIIPSGLIERIDVVTGGASAAYGSDAVAGVVNIVLRKSLEGFIGDVQAGVSQRGDNETYRASLAWGTKLGDRGNFIIAAEGEQNEGVGFQTTRGWARRGFAQVELGGTPAIRVVPNAQFALQTLGGLVTRGALAGTDFGPGGVPRPFAAAPGDGFYVVGGSGVNASDYASLSVPYKRWSVFGKGDYDLGIARFFVEGSYAWSQGNANVVPASNFGSLTIQQDNVFLNPGLRTRLLSAGQTSFNMGRFSLDYGVLTSKITNRTTRLVAGLDGKFGAGWTWNVYGQYGKNDADTDRGNNAVLARLARSVDAVAGPGGTPACRVNVDLDPSNDDPACVPVNLFGFGSPSEAAKAYFLGVSRLNTRFTQWVAAATVNGDLFSITDRPVTIALGGEYRDEKVVAVADAISQANGFAFGNPKSLRGSRNIAEGFAEVLVPLLSNVPFAKSFDLNGAIRLTDYSNSGTVTTWKAGATWDINDSIRIRGTRSRDIRAPSLSELFATSNVLFATVRDGGFNGPVEFVSGGNPGLQPETADTWSAGVVLTPSFLSGFRASVDYYDIKIKGAITTLPAQQIVDLCAAGTQSLCSFLVRDGTGRLVRINASQVNAARRTTSGVDIEAAYTTRFANGATLSLRGLATYVDKLTLTNGTVTIDRAGEVGGDNGGLPHWRFNLAATYSQGPVTFFVENRFIGGGRYDNTLGPSDIDLVNIKARNYVNASITFNVLDTPTKRFQVFFNVQNLLDQDPPIVPSTFIAPPQTNAVLYDVVGRMFQAGARVRF